MWTASLTTTQPRSGRWSRRPRKIMHAPDMPVCATCVRVPVYTSHSESVNAEFSRPHVPPRRPGDILSRSPGVTVQDNPGEHLYPLPILAAGTDDVFVGRIRRDISHPRGLAMWVVSRQPAERGGPERRTDSGGGGQGEDANPIQQEVGIMVFRGQAHNSDGYALRRAGTGGLRPGKNAWHLPFWSPGATA